MWQYSRKQRLEGLWGTLGDASIPIACYLAGGSAAVRRRITRSSTTHKLACIDRVCVATPVTDGYVHTRGPVEMLRTWRSEMLRMDGFSCKVYIIRN